MPVRSKPRRPVNERAAREAKDPADSLFKIPASSNSFSYEPSAAPPSSRSLSSLFNICRAARISQTSGQSLRQRGKSAFSLQPLPPSASAWQIHSALRLTPDTSRAFGSAQPSSASASFPASLPASPKAPQKRRLRSFPDRLPALSHLQHPLQLSGHKLRIRVFHACCFCLPHSPLQIFQRPS